MPRTKEQFEAVKESRKNKILSDAAKVFALEGYNSVTVDKIVEKAKCSHGLFYHYFKNKDDIFKAILSKLTFDKFNEYNSRLDSLEPIVALRMVCQNIIDQISTDGDTPYMLYIFLTYNLQKNPPEIFNDQKPMSGFNKILEIIKLGQEKGQIAEGNPEHYLICFISLLRGLVYTHINKPIDKKSNELPSVDIIMNLFIRKN